MLRARIAMRPHPSPSQMAKSVPRVHNYALKIPWAHVGRGAQLRHAPKRGLNRTRGFPFGYSSFSFRTLISGNTVRQHCCRTHDAATKEADIYVIPRNSQVDYNTERNIRFHIIPQLSLGRDIVLLFAYRTICIILL